MSGMNAHKTSGADHRQTSGFMRDARRSGTGRHVPYLERPLNHHKKPRWVDSGRRLNSSQSIQDRRTPATSRSREKTTNLMQQVPANVNIEALNEAREEIRGVMQQNVNCADPSESAY